jgi:chitinase
MAHYFHLIYYRNLDFFNILSYDYHSAYEPVVNHHAPLYSGGDPDDEYNFDAQLSIVN